MCKINWNYGMDGADRWQTTKVGEIEITYTEEPYAMNSFIELETETAFGKAYLEIHTMNPDRIVNDLLEGIFPTATEFDGCNDYLLTETDWVDLPTQAETETAFLKALGIFDEDTKRKYFDKLLMDAYIEDFGVDICTEPPKKPIQRNADYHLTKDRSRKDRRRATELYKKRIRQLAKDICPESAETCCKGENFRIPTYVDLRSRKAFLDYVSAHHLNRDYGKGVR